MGECIETLRPAGLEVAVRLHDAPRLGEALRTALPGWPCALESETAGRELRVWRDGGDYHRAAYGEIPSSRCSGVAEATCGLIADLIPEALAARPEAVGLHAAAVEVDGRLVVFPATHRAGKSLLCASFAAAGYRVFADDVLLLMPDGQGMALGIAPRLRLPLPEGLPAELMDFLAAHLGVRDARYGYLTPGAGRLAAHGERRPIAAIVMPDRQPGLEAPSLTPLSSGKGLMRLLAQCLAGDDRDPAARLERLLPILRERPCRLLRYDQPLAALQAVVTGMTDAPPEVSPHPQAGLAPTPAAEPSGIGASATATVWRRSPVAAEVPLGDELFLVDDAGGVHACSALAAAIWRLLGLETLSGDEIVALLAARFPEVERGRLVADVSALFEGLAACRLVAAVEAA
ncbi:PqqD family peptide modification chaperone [Halomonas borealis]|uniref:PqqD family peptide modification chaperone n=1 Tax=Halomonas borealis TaxID=2508710 RepID=UPI0010A03788|nr:PqqD family protein [Halomonas borealis]